MAEEAHFLFTILMIMIIITIVLIDIHHKTIMTSQRTSTKIDTMPASEPETLGARKMKLATIITVITVTMLVTTLTRPSQAKEPVLTPKQQLGKQLFFDARLSHPDGQSCASCHAPESGLADPDKTFPVSKGVFPDRFGNRNSPSAAYMAFSPVFHYDPKEELYVGGQFWDGRVATLAEQAKEPFLNVVEMANPDKATVIKDVRNAIYAPLFKRVYGPESLNDVEQAYEHVADAIAAFESTQQFNAFTSKFDYYLAGKVKLTKQEQRGLKLYEAEDKGNCAACHPLWPDENDGTPPLFTDFTYDNLGVPRTPTNPFYTLPKEFNPDGKKFVDIGLAANPQVKADGRAQQARGKVKVPTLRNIALTAPYMHNGYFNDLRNVVDFYNTRDTKPACPKPLTSEAEAIQQGCWPAAEIQENVNKEELGNLKLTEQEVDDIVAFMLTLTDGYSPQAGKN
jgi:cytochrome c peroxidase